MSPVEDGRPAGTRTGPVEEPWPPVVVGVDGSDSARHAAQWAADVASAWGAPVHLLHAVPEGIGDRASTPSWLHELHDAVERGGVDEVKSTVVAASATDALTARSRGAALVVVGSYGAGARSGMLAGSAALTLVEAAECPVAVVRGAAPGQTPPRRGPVVVGTDAATDDVLHLGAAL